MLRALRCRWGGASWAGPALEQPPESQALSPPVLSCPALYLLPSPLPRAVCSGLCTGGPLGLDPALSSLLPPPTPPRLSPSLLSRPPSEASLSHEGSQARAAGEPVES